MKKMIKFLLSLAVLISSSQFLLVESYADEVCVHGNSGLFQDPLGYMHRFGWGLDFYIEDAGWIQYAIPIDPNNSYQTIRIHTYLPDESKDLVCALIGRVDIWDGNRKITGYKPHISGIDSRDNDIMLPGINEFYIHLPSKTKFKYGLGVSILPVVEDFQLEIEKNHCLKQRMKILSVCVE